MVEKINNITYFSSIGYYHDNIITGWLCYGTKLSKSKLYFYVKNSINHGMTMSIMPVTKITIDKDEKY